MPCPFQCHAPFRHPMPERRSSTDLPPRATEQPATSCRVSPCWSSSPNSSPTLPLSPQRHYANGPRVPIPYPPSFVSFTTRRPGSERIRPFRPSQPDPTPDLFAGRSSKSLIDSYIPSWEVLRLIRQHQPQQGFTPIARQTLAYPAPAHLRLYKRDSQEDRSRIVKETLPEP